MHVVPPPFTALRLSLRSPLSSHASQDPLSPYLRATAESEVGACSRRDARAGPIVPALLPLARTRHGVPGAQDCRCGHHGGWYARRLPTATAFAYRYTANSTQTRILTLPSYSLRHQVQAGAQTLRNSVLAPACTSSSTWCPCALCHYMRHYDSTTAVSGISLMSAVVAWSPRIFRKLMAICDMYGTRAKGRRGAISRVCGDSRGGVVPNV